MKRFGTGRTVALAASALAAAALGAAVATAAPARETARAPRANIVQTAASTGKFTTLVALVKQAGLVGALSGKGPLTVLAPTDAAFAKVPKAALAALAKDRAKLRAVLLYHVVKGKVTAAEVVERTSVKTLQGGNVPVSVKGSRVYLGPARVVQPDVSASNGVIHVIDRVLIPRA